MIDRRRFLSRSALSISGAYLARCTRLAAAEKAVTEGASGPQDSLKNPRRHMRVVHRYANLPVRTGASLRRMRVVLNGAIVREFYIELADAEPQWWAVLDLTPFRGKRLVFEVDELPKQSAALDSIVQSDTIKGAEDLYHERARPQLHFSSRRGWINDPNGLVYYAGEYHLFFQHNPYGWNWGNMHWGHAVSADLVHWKELPEALYPDEHGVMFSGSAVVDERNTGGFQKGDEKAMVAIFTAAPIGDQRRLPHFKGSCTQGLAFSNDRGRTWTKYAGNPVLPPIHQGTRDPNVQWFEPHQKWLMALYLDKQGSTDFSAPEDKGYALFSSQDLKKWDKLCDVTLLGDAECPNFFEIPVTGRTGETRWIFSGAAGRYMVGSFDGQVFVPESGPYVLHHGNCFYSAQTFNHIPAADGRRILIPWGPARNAWGVADAAGMQEAPIYYGMPFNQMMGLPVELTLRPVQGGLQLFAEPVKELQSLRVASSMITPQPLRPGDNPLADVQGELLDITVQLTVGEASTIEFDLRGVKLTYDVRSQELSCQDKKAPLEVQDGRIRLRLLVDRTSVDIFGNDGRLYMPMGMSIPADNRSLQLSAQGGNARIDSLTVFELQSAWTRVAK